MNQPQQQYYDQQYPQEQVVYQNTPVSSDEVYASQLNQELAKNIIAQISPDNQLFEIEMRVRGYKKDVMSGQWVLREGTTPPNELLIDRFMGFLSSAMNQSTTFSNLNESQINRIMEMAIKWVVDDVDNNAELYKLSHDYTERSRVCNLVLLPLFIVLSRALNGQESRRIFKIMSLSESTGMGQPPQKKSWTDAFKFWK